MRIRYLLTSTAMAVGLALGLLWLLETANAADPAGIMAERRVCLLGPPTCAYATIQAAVDASNAGDVIKVAAGVYAGVNSYGGLSQVVYISKTVTIRGGYTTTNWSAFDPVANRTTLNAGQAGRVIYITGAVAPTIEGLHITGGDATGLGGGVPNWRDAGGGIYVVTATAAISKNVISGNVASASAPSPDGMCGGVFLYYSNALVANNEISDNTAAWGGAGAWTADGTGGGLHAEGGAPRVVNNRIVQNAGAVGGLLFANGSGGGLAFVESRPQVITNQILENTAGGGFGNGGGVYLAACPAFTLTNNVIADNQADYSGSGIEIGSMSGVPSRGRDRKSVV